MSPRQAAASPAMSAATTKKAVPAAKANTKSKFDSCKPKRPLSAYNLFFQHERDRLLRGIESPFGYSHDLNHCTLGRKPSVRADRSKKVRPPPHGKIGFAQLAKTVGANWKSLDERGRRHFKDRAAAEKARYRREIEVWKRKRAEGFVASSSSSSSPSSSSSLPNDPTPPSSSALTASPTAVVAPPPCSGSEGDRFHPLPPKSARYGQDQGQHQQQYAQYYNTNSSGVPPPLSYAPNHQQPPPQQHAGWFDWNASPQPSSMTAALPGAALLANSRPNYSYQAQQQRVEKQPYYYGKSYDSDRMPTPYSNAAAHHDQQQFRPDSERNYHKGGEQFFPPLLQMAEPNPLPELPSEGEIIFEAQPSSLAIKNPSDVLDFLAKFVCDA